MNLRAFTLPSTCFNVVLRLRHFDALARNEARPGQVPAHSGKHEACSMARLDSAAIVPLLFCVACGSSSGGAAPTDAATPTDAGAGDVGSHPAGPRPTFPSTTPSLTG